MTEEQSRKADTERRIKAQELLVKILRGESINPRDIPKTEKLYKCDECQDTAFVVFTAYDGTSRARRCKRCRQRVDDERRKTGKDLDFEDKLPDAPKPPRDWKQAAGFDGDDE